MSSKPSPQARRCGWKTARCLRCGTKYETAAFLAGGKSARPHDPSCERCGGLVKPDVVLFGEPLGPAFGVAEREIEKVDLLLVLGSSLVVYPAAGFPITSASRVSCSFYKERG